MPIVHRPNSLHRVDWKILGQGIFVGSLRRFFSLFLSWFKGIRQMPGSSDGQDY